MNELGKLQKKFPSTVGPSQRYLKYLSVFGPTTIEALKTKKKVRLPGHLNKTFFEASRMKISMISIMVGYRQYSDWIRIDIKVTRKFF